MSILVTIQKAVSSGVEKLYDHKVDPDSIQISQTRKDFEGDFTVVVFPFTKIARKKPEVIGQELGDFLAAEVEEIADFNIIKGFLNLSLSQNYWKAFLDQALKEPNFGQGENKGQKVMVEFSSPNTNKPLHLGHIRNILLGWSCSQILKTAGYEVIKTQIVNDRGIAICRSMVAWLRFGDGKTPESEGIKGDHFVGKFYVKFSQAFDKEYQAWQETPIAREVVDVNKKEDQSEADFFNAYKNQYFNEYSELGQEAKEMLIKWEAGDTEVRALWEKMNGWVYQGFDETYQKLGVNFDKIYYESDTYLLGKEMISKGLEKEVFQQDGKRIWLNLEDVKLGKKTVIKSDGTSTYTSQDIGTAHQRYLDYGIDKMVYVVGDEQNNHFQVLFEILKRLEEPYANGLYHLSYGMVDLPTGRMKSREGTVVDADDLVAEVIEEARNGTAERGDIAEFSKEEQDEIIRRIGLAALKFFIIKVNPKKRMVFDPKESVDLQGQTGPYIQYSYVRIHGVLNRAEKEGINMDQMNGYGNLEPQELELLQQAHQFPSLIQEAAEHYDPSLIANYCYTLAKSYHKFWHDLSIFNAGSDEAIAFRLQMSKLVGHILKTGLHLLGIEVPQRM